MLAAEDRANKEPEIMPELVTLRDGLIAEVEVSISVVCVCVFF